MDKQKVRSLAVFTKDSNLRANLVLKSRAETKIQNVTNEYSFVSMSKH